MDGDIQVAILSSRPTLDLAINTWLPGYLARSSTDLDVVVDLTQDGGVIVIDLLHDDAPKLIRSLRDRGVDRPIVVLASASQTYEPPMTGDMVVANSAAIGDLSAAFEEAQAQHRSRGVLRSPEGPGDPGSRAGSGDPGSRAGSGDPASATAVIDLRDTDGPESTPERDADERSSTAVIDLPDTDGPESTPERDADERSSTAGEDAARSTKAAEDEARSTMFVAREQPPQRRRDRRDGGNRRRVLGLGRRSRRASGLLQDSVADLAAHPASTHPSPTGDVSEGSPMLEADSDAPPVDPEPTALIDLTDPSGLSEPLFPSEAAANDAMRRDPPLGRLIDAWSVARSWVILEALEAVIGSGSAVVAVSTSDHSYDIVAGVGIAPAEARRGIPANHSAIAELRHPGGWFIRSKRAAGSHGPLLPLAECIHLLALAVPGSSDRPDAVVVVGRHEPFDADEAARAAGIVQDRPNLDARLQRLQSPGTELIRASRPHAAGEEVALTGWQVLDDLFPVLDGAAAVVAFRDHDLYAASAAVRVNPKQAGRVFGADHALLEAIRGNAAGTVVRAASDNRALLSGLPLPHAAFVAALPIGDVDRPHGLALLSHHRRIEHGELERWHAILAAHPVQSLEA